MYTVLARKYRSGSFDDVVGQDAIAQTLKNAIRTGRVAHAYLFSGTRGVGKTTMARILAKALNCLSVDKPTIEPCCKCDSCKAVSTGEDIDVIEIDGASNRGIDNIRELREKAIYRPARARHKIYIIDEVHMLTSESFNALLKILEEPPAHVKFIFATTEPNKVLATIQSRCQRFDFVNISAADIAKQLRFVLESEKIRYEEDVTILIAKLADGSMRDALSLLDQLLSTGIDPLTVEAFEKYLGQPNREKIAELVANIAQSDGAGVLVAVNDLMNKGQSATQVVVSAIELMRDVMVVKVAGAKADGLVVLTSSQKAQAKELGDKFDSAALIYNISALEKLRYTIRNSDTPRALLEAALLRLALSEHFMSFADMLAGSNTGDVKKKQIVSQASQPAAAMQTAGPVPTAAVEAIGGLENIDAIKEKWGQIVERAAGENRAIGGLLGSSVPVELAGNVLTLAVNNDFNKQLCESKAGQIEAGISGCMGKPFKVKFTVTDAAAGGNKKPPGAKTSQQQRMDAMNDPAVNLLVTEMRANIIEIQEQ